MKNGSPAVSSDVKFVLLFVACAVLLMFLWMSPDRVSAEEVTDDDDGGVAAEEQYSRGANLDDDDSSGGDDSNEATSEETTSGNDSDGGNPDGGDSDGATSGNGGSEDNGTSCQAGAGTRVGTLEGAGSGVKNSNPFEVENGNLIITATSDPTSTDPNLAGVTVSIVDANTNDSVNFGFAVDGDTTESSFERVEPGSYYIRANAANTRYIVTVDDCTGQTTDNGQTGDNGQAGGDRRGEVVSGTVPKKPLANTGGFAPSAASVLLPAGALLVASGAMTFWLGTRRR